MHPHMTYYVFSNEFKYKITQKIYAIFDFNYIYLLNRLKLILIFKFDERNTIF